MTTYQYPSIIELQQIEQDLMPVLTQDDPIFEIMPIVDVDADRLAWDQEDDFTGLTTLRGVNGQPGAVQAVGAHRYEVRPGVYGDFATIDEEELTSRGRLGQWNVAANVDDLVRGRQDQLLHRRINRIRWLGWKLVTSGSYNVLSRNGAQHTDTYDLQDYNASTWGTPSTATPLADFRGAQLLSRGHSVLFGSGATAFMNRTTLNNMLANTNAADLYGKRTSGLANVLSLAEANTVLAAEDLPQMRVWDDGYKDDSGTFQLFVPNGLVAIVGKRMGGAKILDFAYTRNANNPNSAPGAYTYVVDRTQGEIKTTPPTMEVQDGFNGGLRVFFPSALILMDVS